MLGDMVTGRSRPSDAGIRYLSTLSFSDEWLERLRRVAPGAVIHQQPARRVEDIDPSVWAEIDVLHTGAVVPDPSLAPRLRWIQLDTAGTDHLVTHPIWATEVAITTIGGVSPRPMAEYVAMMVLAQSHHLVALLDGQKRREWPSSAERWTRFVPRAVSGTTMGIVGFGRIGSEIGRVARSLGIRVIGVTRSEPVGTTDNEVVNAAHILDVAPRCDWLVVVTPLTTETRGLISAEVLAALPHGAVIINVSRGGVVDELALLDALNGGRLAGAVLDVFDEEPLGDGNPLWSHPRVIVTPHVSGFAPHYEEAVLELVSDNLKRFVTGETLRNLVDRSRGY